MDSPKLRADDTPVPVLAAGTGKTKTGRLWVSLRDNRRWRPSDMPAALFRYSPDRKGERPREHLKTFAGFLQADAYAGFDRLYDPKRTAGVISPVACWAHGAAMYSLLETAKLNGVNPERWLSDVLNRIGKGHPINRIDELLPWNAATPLAGS
ncbi:hypothetical protein NVSP9465_03824 [Novosphingobium sp. CECT 9465]|nr:hypothetical protein NVSP9465_03824 [Novosphingobium sp. CECT 9465]